LFPSIGSRIETLYLYTCNGFQAHIAEKREAGLRGKINLLTDALTQVEKQLDSARQREISRNGVLADLSKQIRLLQSTVKLLNQEARTNKTSMADLKARYQLLLQDNTLLSSRVKNLEGLLSAHSKSMPPNGRYLEVTA